VDWRQHREGGMTRRLRINSFLAALGCFALAAGIYHLGFELWPPSVTMADGRTTTFRSAEVEACLRGRVLAWFGDRNGDAYWLICRQQLLQYRALGRARGSVLDRCWFWLGRNWRAAGLCAEPSY